MFFNSVTGVCSLALNFNGEREMNQIRTYFFNQGKTKIGKVDNTKKHFLIR